MSADVKHVYGDGPLWVTDVKAKLPIFIPKGATGVAALPPMTVPALFHETAAKKPGAEGAAPAVRALGPLVLAIPYSGLC